MYDGYGRRGGSAFGTFLLGGILGAILGLLFAPRSGKETRDIIAERVEDYWGGAGEFYSTGREKVSEIASTTKEAATEKSEELRERIDRARERLQEQVAKSAEGAKNKIQEVTPAAKDAVDKAAAGTKDKLDTAASKAAEGLDLVVKKATGEETPVDPAVAVAEVKAAVDEAVSATAGVADDRT